ncbi:MAG: hypothetical protein IJL70_08570 [Treponema sp.]|nr:hypothetical protein [Treponema sp.]
MNGNGTFEKIINAFNRYYDISTENIAGPFCAEAVFKSHGEQYFLVKSAKVADIDSNDFVFFCDCSDCGSECNSECCSDNDGKINGRVLHEQGAEPVSFCLSCEKLEEIAATAWERGLSKVSPYYGHRNSDVTLILFADRISEDAFKKIKKINYYKSYAFGFYGWSGFRLLAYEASTGRAVTNRRGADLKNLIGNI